MLLPRRSCFFSVILHQSDRLLSGTSTFFSRRDKSLVCLVLLVHFLKKTPLKQLPASGGFPSKLIERGFEIGGLPLKHEFLFTNNGEFRPKAVNDLLNARLRLKYINNH